MTDNAPLRASTDTGYAENGSEYTVQLARADVDTVTITVGPNRIVARGLKTQMTCRYSPFINGLYVQPEKSVVDVTVNGQRVAADTGGPDIVIPGVGTLHILWIGSPQSDDTVYFQARALWLEGPGVDVVASESIIAGGGFGIAACM